MSRDGINSLAQTVDEQRAWDTSTTGRWNGSTAVGWGSSNDGAFGDFLDCQEQDYHTRSSAMNTTFDTDLFEFGTTVLEEGAGVDFLEAPPLFPDDPFDIDSPVMSDLETGGLESTVHVSIHEVLTSLYDGCSGTSSCQVEGFVYVRSSNNTPFCLCIRDHNCLIATLNPDTRLCEEITPTNFIDNGIYRFLRVTLPLESTKNVKILAYQCNGKLRPIPMLVKTKVQVAKKYCRLGIKIRSNPENLHSLTQLAVIVAVPPDVHGESVRLSRKGGVWDAMKRIVAWSIETLGPGELIEIQAQFDFVGGEASSRNPKFPVLVRCDAQKEQFSNIEVTSDVLDQFSTPAKVLLARSVRILHRKV